jgi:hypothetical protein
MYICRLVSFVNLRNTAYDRIPLRCPISLTLRGESSRAIALTRNSPACGDGPCSIPPQKSNNKVTVSMHPIPGLERPHIGSSPCAAGGGEGRWSPVLQDSNPSTGTSFEQRRCSRNPSLDAGLLRDVVEYGEPICNVDSRHSG